VAGRGVLMEKRDVFRIKKLFKTNQAQAKQIVLFAEKTPKTGRKSVLARMLLYIK
jgi:hypothetical protein